MNHREEVWKAALAGLLHDIGKFTQRAGEKLSTQFTNEDAGSSGTHARYSQQFIEQYIPQSLREGLSGVLYHHRNDIASPVIKRIRIADQLAAGERWGGSEIQADPREARLIPILANVELLAPKPTIHYEHSLRPLTIKDKSAYPVESQLNQGDYSQLWQQMKQELDEWKKKRGATWDNQPIKAFFTTLLAVFQKYLWCVPSATPWKKDEKDKPLRSWPDVSLYDHNRLTSAIAACLAYDDHLPEPDEDVALLVRGDLSGIQRFIYRLSRPDAETAHVAKRLRGRSFYVQLLSELVVEWILNEIGLPDSCAIFIGGGRFDLLLPTKSEKKVEDLYAKLSHWLYHQFQGELALLMASAPANAGDLADSRKIFRELDRKLEEAKLSKWVTLLSPQQMAVPGIPQYHVCKVCQLTPMPDSGLVCDLCQIHAQIGKELPYLHYLAYCYKPASAIDKEKIISFKNAPFNISVVLLREKIEIKDLPPGSKVFSINETEDFIFADYASSFRFLANSAPRALKDYKGEAEESIQQGDILHFEAIAKLSRGAERLGILKADVDRFGLIMSEGLSEEDSGKAPTLCLRPTLSRMASLSRMLDLFFSGQLNRICQEVSDEWAKDNPQKATLTDGIFYILYSGGDDLFIVGPWEEVLQLAERVRKEFNAFSANNPNLTISAGYVQVKPRYPVQKFAELVDQAEQVAKQQRNQIHAFGTTMDWDHFDQLLELAHSWSKAVQNGEIPSGLIYDLGGLFRQHSDSAGSLRPLWTPRLYYSFARRLNKQSRQKYQEGMLRAISTRKILFPISVTSLLIRERRM